MMDPDHSGFEGVNTGRNLLLSALLHVLVISAFAGGVFSHTSGMPPSITAATVYLYAEPEGHNSISAPGGKDVASDSLPKRVPPETPFTEKIRLPANLQIASSEIISSPVQKPFSEISAGPSSSAAGTAAINSRKDASTDEDSGAPGNTGNSSAGQGVTYGSQSSAVRIRNNPSKGSGNEESIRRIRDHIAKAKYYPAMAKKRGIEGTVTVEFSINPEGKPENLRVIKTSGYEILDSAAMGTVTKAAPLPLHPARMEVPITFRLTNAE